MLASRVVCADSPTHSSWLQQSGCRTSGKKTTKSQKWLAVCKDLIEKAALRFQYFAPPTPEKSAAHRRCLASTPSLCCLELSQSGYCLASTSLTSPHSSFLFSLEQPPHGHASIAIETSSFHFHLEDADTEQRCYLRLTFHALTKWYLPCIFTASYLSEVVSPAKSWLFTFHMAAFPFIRELLVNESPAYLPLISGPGLSHGAAVLTLKAS